MDMEISISSGGPTGKENPFLTSVASVVCREDLEAARARARALGMGCVNSLGSVEPGNSKAKVLSQDCPEPMVEIDKQRLASEHGRESLQQEQIPRVYQEERNRSSTPLSGLRRGYHRDAVTPRYAYQRSLNSANFELMSFREKFDAWRMAYDREIAKTKATLASMAPTLHGLGMAARIHKIAGKVAESLNPTPCRTSSTPAYSTVETTPREPWLRVHLEQYSCQSELLSNADELTNYDDDYDEFEPPICSPGAGTLAEVNEDMNVLTTIIEKKIFATRVAASSVSQEEFEDQVDLSAWSDVGSEGALTARSPKIETKDIPTDLDDDESPTDDASDNVDVHASSMKTLALLDIRAPRPSNLRDNLIILAKQKSALADAPALLSARERAMILLRKMYAPQAAAQEKESTPSDERNLELHKSSQDPDLPGEIDAEVLTAGQLAEASKHNTETIQLAHDIERNQQTLFPHKTGDDAAHMPNEISIHNGVFVAAEENVVTSLMTADTPTGIGEESVTTSCVSMVGSSGRAAEDGEEEVFLECDEELSKKSSRMNVQTSQSQSVPPWKGEFDPYGTNGLFI